MPLSRRHLVILALFAFGSAIAGQHQPDLDAIAGVLDDFHDAAAKGDKDRYLGHLADDAVFMGTDEWERWPKTPDFVAYVNSRFRDGSGWSYRPVDRNIRLADSGDVAWFDEVIFSETNGYFRGTGVLIRKDRAWKIAHYAMSFLVFNEDWEKVIELTRKTRADKEGDGPDR